ncbi:hypothetical protein LTR36_010208 [Oleoguttula mirabilis]|uniref:Uncharacterized protein n=1 Tax=Oleoguttula mirabilis TaxID=1507867 RepID=A0AAV9JRQ5_9PEZI|nr:hypothetical protein LTR36_010208 [Oleoguttula mirabilis]
MDETAKATLEVAKQTFGKLIGGLEHVTWDNLPESVKEYMRAHPTLTAIQIIVVIIALVPGLIVAPALGAIGFGSMGPAAASAASGYQAAHGATAGFSFLQSAAMGGYGAAAVNGVVTGASAVAGGVAEWFKWRGGAAA